LDRLGIVDMRFLLAVTYFAFVVSSTGVFWFCCDLLIQFFCFLVFWFFCFLVFLFFGLLFIISKNKT
jgi:hypothetical protein